MAATKQLINLEFDSLNSEAAQFKPFNCTLKGNGQIYVEFEVPSSMVRLIDMESKQVTLTPEGMTLIAAEWYKTQLRAKLRADAELAKEAKGGK